LKPFLFVIIFTSLLFVQPVFGQFFDTPGFVNRFPIETGGYVFEVQTVSSFDIADYQFSSEEKRLSFIFSSGVSNNLAEIQIPKNLINGNFTFYLDDQEIFPDVKTNEKISLVTMEFPGKGLHKLDIIGTTYLPEFSEIAQLVLATSLIGILFLKKIKKKIIH
jgi:hypothetical protein